MSDLSGELIDGRYELQRLIASGGMASIYSAIDVRLDRRVAVKIMHPHLASDEEFVSRFIREAKATAALNHPNIVSIQDQGWNESGVPAVFIVMEFMDGHTLREVLSQGPLSPQEVIHYMIPVASALAEAHRIGIIHRDIKPENILISQDGRIKIADFGLARGASLGSTMTVESSVVLGSVSYLSPEQVQRGISDARSDIYSFGVVLFELLTGKKPFDGSSPIQIAYMHVNERIPTPSSARTGVPASLDALVWRATSPNPDERFPHAGALLKALRDIQFEIDPSKRQLTLEIDAPMYPLSKTSKPGARSGARGVQAKKILNILSGDSSPKSVGTPAISLQKEVSTSMSKRDTNTNSRESTANIRRRTSARVKRNRAIALLLVLSLAFYGWYQIAGPGSKIAVPSVVGLTEREAASTLTPLLLHEKVESVQFSEDVPKGKIISSNPGGGGHLDKEGTVLLIISKGPERIAVPTLVGLSLDAATAALATARLKLGDSTQVYDGKVPLGYIAGTTPAAKSKVRPNSVVNLIISKGIQVVPLTSYVGKSADQANTELTDAGFSVNSTFGYSESVAPGYVIAQDPDGSAPTPAGATVNLIVSQGPELVYIPNIFSLTEKAATTALENLQLVVKVKRVGAKKVKKVVSVSPKVGKQVKRGSTVTITVG